MRKTSLVTGEYYHVYNRGVDRRTIFQDGGDLDRFYESIHQFNCVEPIGSIFLNSFSKDKVKEKKLVEIISYCLNSNHYHFILLQASKNGISEFMKRLSGGYTQYFNTKHKRSGALFQGKFKSNHIDSNEYLLHASAYVNLNNRFKGEPSRLSKSSWDEYVGQVDGGICNTGIILDQFKNRKYYKEFALSSLEDIISRKELEKELEY